MLYYNLIYFIPALAVFINLNQYHKNSKYFEYSFLLLIILLVGLRYQIGGDWIWYERNYKTYGEINLITNFNYTFNYGYVIINHLFYNLGLDYYYVNIFFSFILVFSINFFINTFKLDKFLSYCIFFPVGILVVGMGFVRQGCAMSFMLISLSFLKKEKQLFSFIFIMLGITFHKSLIIFFPVIFLFFNNLYKFIIILFSFIFISLFYNDFIKLLNIYLGSRKNIDFDPSKGAFVRIMMSVIPSIIFIIFYSHFKVNLVTKKIITLFSFFIILSSLLFFYRATFVDRIFLYLIFFQVIVFSLFSKIFSDIRRYYIRIIIVTGYLFVLNFFLIFATHSHFWVPYKNIFINL